MGRFPGAGTMFPPARWVSVIMEVRQVPVVSPLNARGEGAQGRKAVSESVSRGLGVQTLLHCPASRMGGVGLQSRCPSGWDYVAQARPNPALLCTSLNGTHPLCPSLSFLTDTGGHRGWDAPGGGRSVLADCLPESPGCGVLSSVGPSPFMGAAPGPQAGSERH